MTTERQVPRITLNNGVEMPALGLGVFQSPPAETSAAVEAALETGYRHIDTAAAYGNEKEVGQIINTLLRRGITKDSLKIGTEIVVRGYQSKDALCKPKCRANGRDVTFPDGRKLFMGSSGTGAPKDGSDDTEK